MNFEKLKLFFINDIEGCKMVDIIDIILATVQILTLIALILYVKKTWDMAVSTEKSAKASDKTLDEMKETRDQESAPYIVVYFDFQGSEIYLVVENVGKGLAMDINFEFEPKLQNTYGEEINEMSMIKEGIGSVPPKYKIRTFFDMTFSYFDKDLPLKYKVKISYFGGLKDEKRIIEQILDIGYYKHITVLRENGLHELVKEIKNINEQNKKTSDNLEKIRDRLDNGIWIKNPDFLITSLITDNPWKDNIISILLQFKTLWSHIYTENVEFINPFVDDLKNRIDLISTQILIISSKHPDDISDDILDDINEISTKLSDLSHLRFFADGGRSLESFNNSGNEILILIDNLIEKLN